MERYAQSETYYPTYQEGFASNATGVDVSILRCADGFWWDFVAGAFQDAYDANSLSAMVEDANGTNGLWNIEAGWAVPDANAHYQVRFKVTDPTGSFYKEGPKIVVNSTLLDVLADWVNGGRLDLILDAIPTTAMRGTDSAALASVCTEARLSELDVGTAAKMAYYMAKLNINLTNKVIYTEASGNAEQFNDADASLGTISAAVASDGTYTTRKQMVI